MVLLKSKLKSKLRKRSTQRGGNSTLSTFNVVLIGIILFLLYQMSRNDTVMTQVVHKPKVVVKQIIKEVEDQPYRDNIYVPDTVQARRYPPFNIKTRGPPQEYDMIGFIKDPVDSNKLQQLYGRQTYPRSDHWNYYVKSDQYHQIPIPVSVGGISCTDERGCKELSDQSTVSVMDTDHTATVYKPEPYYYNPYVI